MIMNVKYSTARRALAATAILATLAVTAAVASASEGGIYLTGSAFCSSNACSDGTNSGSSCEGVVDGWQNGTFWCDVNET
jgi:hypothetical protein